MQAKQCDLTRDKILEAAFAEIHRQGYQAASITNIVAETGLTKGALYHHFPAKKDLGLAVIDEVIREGMEAMMFCPLRESDQPLETLLEILGRKSLRKMAVFIQLGCPLNNLMQEMSPLDDEFKMRLTAIVQTWQKVIADALKRAKKQQVIRADVDCKAAALFIVAAYEGCVGIAKNMQCAKTLEICMLQLQQYVLGFKP